MYRLFISVDLPPDFLEKLRGTQNQLKRSLANYPLRWTRPEGIHLTLKFLGDTDPARIDDIVAILTQAVDPHPPFEISAGGLGCFPNPNKTSVLWIGVEDRDKRLQKLAASIDNATNSLGWQRERRLYSGHLTLARVQRNAKNPERRHLGQQLSTLGVPQNMGIISVDEIHLMRSQLNPQGAIYTSLATLQLVDK
ncbi:MAG: RNA 2',3'-cyclic phosphodiesterase [Chloroflexi bacterium]|nr:RNA 2',3'-cyclic phosphodiesterase [Chloroflexota bacterium]